MREFQERNAHTAPVGSCRRVGAAEAEASEMRACFARSHSDLAAQSSASFASATSELKLRERASETRRFLDSALGFEEWRARGEDGRECFGKAAGHTRARVLFEASSKSGWKRTFTRREGNAKIATLVRCGQARRSSSWRGRWRSRLRRGPIAPRSSSSNSAAESTRSPTRHLTQRSPKRHVKDSRTCVFPRLRRGDALRRQGKTTHSFRPRFQRDALRRFENQR